VRREAHIVPERPLVGVQEAADALQVSSKTVRRWIEHGAPVASPGHRGGGGATLLDLAALRAWRDRQQLRRAVPDPSTGADPVALRILSAELPHVIEEIMWMQFVESDGPHKGRLAGELAAAGVRLLWTLQDRIARELGEEPETTVPEKLRRLRLISRA
jgi:hypothetical protein